MEQRIVVAGKRKESIAKAVIYSGTGKITINKRDYNLLPKIQKLMIEEPLRIAKQVLGSLNFDINVNVRGGGQEARIEASRLAIARALVEITKSRELKERFLNYDRNLLIADTRRKEACKPNDSKARAARQSSKRWLCLRHFILKVVKMKSKEEIIQYLADLSKQLRDPESLKNLQMPVSIQLRALGLIERKLRGKRILDVGCGKEARLVRYLKKQGIDPLVEKVDGETFLMKRAVTGIREEGIPRPDNYYGLVTANMFILYILDCLQNHLKH